MMTIDEAIKDLKGEYSSPYNNQLAEWLEELKELREGNRTLSLGEGHFITEDNLDKSIDNAYFKGYNEAIDDFVKTLYSKARFVKFDDFINGTLWTEIGEIAEQLKRGDNDDD